MKGNKKRGFTLIELLIVIAVIAIIAGVAFVALDPLTRFRDSRDATRAGDTQAILSAIKLDQVDGDGLYHTNVSGLNAGEVYMIGTGSGDCNAENGSCDTNISGSSNCVDLSFLTTEGYLASVPISPHGSSTAWVASTTGYTLQRDSTGIVHVRSCESENTTEISASR